MADTPAIWLPPFQVNVGDEAVGPGGSNQQSAPYVAALPDGGAAIVWEDYGVRCVFEPADISFRRLDVAGARKGTESPCINSALDWNQTKPSFVPVSANRAYAVYQRSGDPFFGDDVFFDYVDANGDSVGDATAFHFIATTANEGSPTAARLVGGQFAIAFTDDTAGESDLKFDVVADPVNKPSAHLGKTELVDGDGPAVDPDLAALANGNFVVAYAQKTGDVHHLKFVIRQPGGAAVSVADPLIAGGSDDLRDPAVTGLPGGGFVVTWASPAGIQGRIYSAAGVPAGPAFNADGGAPGDQIGPDVSATPTGFVLAWADVPSRRIVVRRFTKAGKTTGSEVRLTTVGAIAVQPKLAELSDGRVALTYTGVRSRDADVFAAILDDRNGPVTGTEGDDKLTAPATGGGASGIGGADRIYGSLKGDSIDGGPGDDVMAGRTGNDVYTVDSSSDKVVEEPDGGTDTVRTSVTYTLPANVEKLTVIGTTGVYAQGNDLANTLASGDGGDTLVGGKNQDKLIGAKGADSFLFDAAPGNANADLVFDFDRSDFITLSRSVMRNLPPVATLSDATFVAGPEATTADQRIVYDATTGKLFYDGDGNGPAKQQLLATFRTKPVLAANRFIIE